MEQSLMIRLLRVVSITEATSYLALLVATVVKQTGGSEAGVTVLGPIHGVLYWQLLARRGLAVQTWLKGARIEYLRPAHTSVELEARITNEELEAAVAALEQRGKFVHTHTLEAHDRGGTLCARFQVEVYGRLLDREGLTTSGD